MGAYALAKFSGALGAVPAGLRPFPAILGEERGDLVGGGVHGPEPLYGEGAVAEGARHARLDGDKRTEFSRKGTENPSRRGPFLPCFRSRNPST